MSNDSDLIVEDAINAFAATIDESLRPVMEAAAEAINQMSA